MAEIVDHTAQVERRVVAIPIRATDCCGFFALRQWALLSRRECWYCAYGSFPKDTDAPHQPGFCKYKQSHSPQTPIRTAPAPRMGGSGISSNVSCTEDPIKNLRNRSVNNMKNWLLLVEERYAADSGFRAQVDGIAGELALKALLDREGVSYEAEDLPALLTTLKGWREQGHALSDLELDTLSAGILSYNQIPKKEEFEH